MLLYITLIRYYSPCVITQNLLMAVWLTWGNTHLNGGMHDSIFARKWIIRMVGKSMSYSPVENLKHHTKGTCFVRILDDLV